VHECQRSLNMQIKTSLNTLNFLTPERMLAELEEQFPPPFTGPEDKIQHIMFNAGQQSIINWIKQRITED
jgi:hypothetical protein